MISRLKIMRKKQDKIYPIKGVNFLSVNFILCMGIIFPLANILRNKKGTA